MGVPYLTLRKYTLMCFWTLNFAHFVTYTPFLLHVPQLPSVDLGPAAGDVSHSNTSQTPQWDKTWLQVSSNYFSQSDAGRKSDVLQVMTAIQIQGLPARAKNTLFSSTWKMLLEHQIQASPYLRASQSHWLRMHGLLLVNGLMNQDHPNGFLLHWSVQMLGSFVHGFSM